MTVSISPRLTVVDLVAHGVVGILDHGSVQDGLLGVVDQVKCLLVYMFDGIHAVRMWNASASGAQMPSSVITRASVSFSTCSVEAFSWPWTRRMMAQLCQLSWESGRSRLYSYVLYPYCDRYWSVSYPYRYVSVCIGMYRQVVMWCIHLHSRVT